MISKAIVWVATAVICCLTLMLLVPTILKVLYGTVKLIAIGVMAHWRGQRLLRSARRMKKCQ